MSVCPFPMTKASIDRQFRRLDLELVEGVTNLVKMVNLVVPRDKREEIAPLVLRLLHLVEESERHSWETPDGWTVRGQIEKTCLEVLAIVARETPRTWIEDCDLEFRTASQS